jgi:hypothetical protein
LDVQVKRTLEVRRPVPADGLSVSQLSALELRQELDRRIRQLQAQRDEHIEKVAQIDAELKALGVRRGPKAAGERSDASPPVPGRSGRRGRSRAVNQQPLVEILAAILDGGSMTARELADAALDRGYVTTSRNFTNSVSVALYRDPRFEKREGKWALAGATTT